MQFPTDDPEALDEFLRIQYPEFNAPENEQVETDALAVLLGEIGPAVVLTHSSTGIRGWITGTKSDKVAAIVSYEPGAVVFPEGEVPPQLDRADGTKVDAGVAIPVAAFDKLTRFPIQIVWGDYVPSRLDPINVGPRLTLDNRRLNLVRSQMFVDVINRHGGKASLQDLPKIGITGNTHFPMLDLNNVQVADLLSQFLKEQQLDSIGASRPRVGAGSPHCNHSSCQHLTCVDSRPGHGTILRPDIGDRRRLRLEARMAAPNNREAAGMKRTTWATRGLLMASAVGLGMLGSGHASAEEVIVGLITKTDTNPFFVKMKEGAEAKAKELGVELQSFAGKYRRRQRRPGRGDREPDRRRRQGHPDHAERYQGDRADRSRRRATPASW